MIFLILIGGGIFVRVIENVVVFGLYFIDKFIYIY